MRCVLQSCPRGLRLTDQQTCRDRSQSVCVGGRRWNKLKVVRRYILRDRGRDDKENGNLIPK